VVGDNFGVATVLPYDDSSDEYSESGEPDKRACYSRRNRQSRVRTSPTHVTREFTHLPLGTSASTLPPIQLPSDLDERRTVNELRVCSTLAVSPVLVGCRPFPASSRLAGASNMDQVDDRFKTSIARWKCWVGDTLTTMFEVADIQLAREMLYADDGSHLKAQEPIKVLVAPLLQKLTPAEANELIVHGFATFAEMQVSLGMGSARSELMEPDPLTLEQRLAILGRSNRPPQ
jgi:hypothetical protein